MHVDAVMFGFCIGYSSGEIKNLITDIQRLRPTIFGSFPGFFNKIYEKIKDNIEESNQLIASFMNQAIQNKMFKYLETGDYNNIMYDATIFYPIRKILGG